MKTNTVRRMLAATAMLLAVSGAASAQVFRAYLSIDGNDANPCTLPAPCRLLPAALTAVASGGEIWMLDSGNYNTGPVSIAKTVTILAVPGVLGSVVALGGDAINVAAAGVTVALRNLNILPFPGHENRTGVNVSAVAKVLVHGSNVSGFTSGNGVSSITAGAAIAVTDSVFHRNFYSLFFGQGASGTVSGSHITDSYVAVYAYGTSATTTSVSISRTVADRGFYGFIAECNTDANARCELAVIDSMVSSMSNWGIVASSGASAISRVTASGNLVTKNTVGVGAYNAGARVYARQNTVSHNGTGFLRSGSSSFFSAGTNGVLDNEEDTLGGITNLGPGT